MGPPVYPTKMARNGRTMVIYEEFQSLLLFEYNDYLKKGVRKKGQLLAVCSRYRTLFPYKPDPMPSFFRHTLRSRIQKLGCF